MKPRVINKTKLNLWDLIPLTIFLLLTSYIFYIVLNVDLKQKGLVGMYNSLTPICLYLLYYRSLRKVKIYIVILIVAICQFLLYLNLQDIEGFTFGEGNGLTGFKYLWIFVVLYQIGRFVSIKTTKSELVSVSYVLINDNDVKDFKRIDIIFFIVYLGSWITLISR